jgi:divinyl chlorophyllide a 8-vinyl-reductase
MEFESGKSCTGEKVVIVGATGYIGKSVVRESVRRGYETIAVVRDAEKAKEIPSLEGATLVEADVTNPESLANSPAFAKGNVDVVISCLASRSGMKKDAYAIDYEATKNALDIARANGARHFVLLSAYCVAKPWLQFQFAKLKFEEALQEQTDVTYSIVRPTAFFKSVSGQVEVVAQGGPFVYFDLGGGKTMTCNPIAEADMAVALIDTIADPAKKNAIWNIGGPDAGLSMQRQGEMVAEAVGKEEPFLLGVPIGIFDAIINSLQWVADTLNSEKFADAAEFGRIGKYYAVEDMLTTDPSEKFGSITLAENYKKIAVEGQEYDPYTTMFAKPGRK